MTVSSRNQKTRLIQVAVVVGILVMFLLDLILPLGVSIGVPYVAIMLLTLWLPHRNAIFRTAGVITVLGIIGLFSPISEWPLSGIAILNRAMALFDVWVAAFLGNWLLAEQDATRQERDFNESLVETASSIILLLDTDARILFFNQCTEDTLEYTLDELKGKDWFDTCVPEPDRARGRGVFSHCLKKGMARDSQFAVLARDGRKYQFSWSTKPMRTAGDEITQMLFVGQDVTSLLEAQNRLVAAERLAAIGQTIAAVSHESHNELMALKMGLDMLSMTVTEASAKQLTDHLQNSLMRLHRLLDDVRHYAGPMQLERSVCSLQDIWQRAWDSLEATWRERDAELQENILCENLRCSVDALRLEQVFRNLFENSLAACSDPLWIEVQATEEKKDGVPFLKISVRDNGPGLSAEAKAKVFEPFFTTKQRGTGLGMPISQRILKAHGGKLSLVDHTGRGAEFLLELPLNHPTPAATESPASESTNRHPRVLK